MDEHKIFVPPSSPGSKDFLRTLDDKVDWVSTSKLIRQGLPTSFFNEVSALVGLQPGEMAALLGVKHSARRRWLSTGRLNSTESDYLFRSAIVLRSALGLFEGDQVAMRNWITRPALVLDNQAPIALFSSFVGLDLIEALIWKIEHGVVV
ncbi:antitoxin Xre/MbcA/ParS toxin-binding domain-containing protein [Pseudomonas prosekii]|uniref:antitoxin Xre/MbcA/ParS toxin-binding domain-containing protein n=1 Tax=Pseudomonas prosekii TaxID=1148509 RepID=UPI0011EB1887|nr:antitoxin Xre/MbcA/ParS toxin-binding domain-containing protein [Pseudomonas prosekii]